MAENIKQHPYYLAITELLDEYIDRPDVLLMLADTDEGRDVLFRQFWINYMKIMATK
jgi:hypothetical protein